MLKLPTSLFECVCFICVNIVSFSSLWGFCSPGLFITVFFQPNLRQTQHELSMFQRKVMRSVCPRWCTFLYFCFLIILRLWIVLYRVLFQNIFNIAVPGRGQIHHLALLLKPWKSKLCLWIAIHQNKFPQCPPHKALITEENLFYLWLSHFWPCFWSTGEPGLYLLRPFLPNWGIFHAALQPQPTFIDRGGHFNMFAYVCRPCRHHCSPARLLPFFYGPIQPMLAVGPVLATQPEQLVCECECEWVQAHLFEILSVLRR